MKVMWLLCAALVLSAGSASAKSSGMGVCSKDALTTKDINKIKPSEKIVLTNDDGEMVGAFEIDSAEKQFSNFYLCGNNSGSYYAEGEINEWITTVGNTIEVGDLYNDEYMIEAKAKTLYVGSKYAKLEITIKVEFTGEPEHADYAPFTARFYADLPVK